MSRIVLAFRSFFAILFSGKLPPDIAQELGLSPQTKAQPVAKPAPPVRTAQPSDGALQILGILQRDSRLIDFLMEDISAYADDQGAKLGTIAQPLRAAATGRSTSPGIFEVLAVLGREQTRRRLAAALSRLDPSG